MYPQIKEEIISIQYLFVLLLLKVADIRLYLENFAVTDKRNSVSWMILWYSRFIHDIRDFSCQDQTITGPINNIKREK